ncbi:hypothetical protein PTB13_17635, partial [Bacillus sp. MHSD17]|nr:hypothetical protein [Bacillus sp. MHSD17]
AYICLPKTAWPPTFNILDVLIESEKGVQNGITAFAIFCCSGRGVTLWTSSCSFANDTTAA